MEKIWKECTFVAFDLETSGAYPMGAEIVEFGAVKWRAGQIVDQLQTLLKVKKKMNEEVIKIHGITNEMLVDAPSLDSQINNIFHFMKDDVLLAHHAPFDMGFLAYEFEKHNLGFPKGAVICTSLLSRRMIPESKNHKLQTLIEFLKLNKGSAHRALDDAKACLELALVCMNRAGEGESLKKIQKLVGVQLEWPQYSLLSSTQSASFKGSSASNNEAFILKNIVESLNLGKDLDLVYEGGSHSNKVRRVSPIGVVRNPQGDFLFARCHIDGKEKRFYLNKVKDLSLVY